MTTNRYMMSDDHEWQASESEGYWIKRLHEDDERGETSWLMRMEPGCTSPPHAHEDFEEVYVLEGSFDDGERVLKAGDYVAREAGAMHSGKTTEGATMLVIYRKR